MMEIPQFPKSVGDLRRCVNWKLQVWAKAEPQIESRRGRQAVPEWAAASRRGDTRSKPDKCARRTNRCVRGRVGGELVTCICACVRLINVLFLASWTGIIKRFKYSSGVNQKKKENQSWAANTQRDSFLFVWHLATRAGSQTMLSFAAGIADGEQVVRVEPGCLQMYRVGIVQQNVVNDKWMKGCFVCKKS